MRVLIYLVKLSKEQSGWQSRELKYRWTSLNPVENS